MEYLLVEFDGEQEVLVDDEPMGRTNEVLELEKGTYTISLDCDTKPKSVRIKLKDTSPVEPLEISFEKA